MKLLIGYDGSECANAAIDDLTRAGLLSEADVLVLTIADVWLPPTPEAGAAEDASQKQWVPELLVAARKAANEAVSEAVATAAAGAARVKAQFPGWTVRSEARADSPYWALIKVAEEWEPDLLVVGSNGRSAINRFILGSVSQQTMSNASCSVRIARPHSKLKSQDPVRIVIGIDGSPESAAAVQAVAMRKWPANSEVNVVAVVDGRMLTAAIGPFPPHKTLVDLTPLTAENWARNAVDQTAEELRDAGLKVVTSVRDGDPKRILVREAQEWGADSVFVGAKGLTRLDRFLIGSVSSAVAAQAHCSVEVIRHG